MRNSLKGATSAVSALVLLAGGAGTFAYWSADSPVEGADVAAGRLALLPGAGCGEWQLSHGAAPVVDLAPDTLLVPGDVLTRSCSFEIDAQGENLRSRISVAEPTFTGGDFDGNLTASITPVKIGAETVARDIISSADDGKALEAQVSVVWDAADTLHMDALTALDDLVVVATQIAP